MLSFSLPATHPLTVTLYLEYSTLLEPRLLEKASVLLAVKNFGEFHHKTTELYSKFYREGSLEYVVKIQRVNDIESVRKVCA